MEINKDLVCGMEIPEGSERRHFSEYGGGKYWFCSSECKRQFDDHPDQYIQENAREQLPRA